MPMLTALLAGAITQGMAAHRAAAAAKEQRQLLKEEKNLSSAGYYQGLGEASASAPAAQARMAQLRTMAERQNGISENAAIAGNLTTEQQLAAGQRTAATMAGAVNQATMAEAAQKQQLRRQFRQEQSAVNAQERRLKKEEAYNWNNLGANLSKALVAAINR